MKAAKYTLVVLLVLVLGYVAAVKLDLGSVFANSESVQAVQELFNADDTQPTLAPVPTATLPSYEPVLNPWERQQAWLVAQKYDKKGFFRSCTPKGECFVIQNFVDPTTNVADYAFWSAIKTLVPSEDAKSAIEVIMQEERLSRSDFFNRYGYIAYAQPSEFGSGSVSLRPGYVQDSTPAPTPEPSVTPAP
jgi:hypothetical protein